MATAIRAGLKSGATSNWARSSTSRASVNALPTSTAKPCRPTTTRKARRTKLGNICRNPSSSRRADRKKQVSDSRRRTLDLGFQTAAKSGGHGFSRADNSIGLSALIAIRGEEALIRPAQQGRADRESCTDGRQQHQITLLEPALLACGFHGQRDGSGCGIAVAVNVDDHAFRP